MTTTPNLNDFASILNRRHQEEILQKRASASVRVSWFSFIANIVQYPTIHLRIHFFSLLKFMYAAFHSFHMRLLVSFEAAVMTIKGPTKRALIIGTCLMHSEVD